MLHFVTRRWGSVAMLLGLMMVGSLGCTTNMQYDYRAKALTLPSVAVTRTVAVAAQDQRPAVLKGEEKPDYVGSQRGGYGNPWKIKTEGEVPLAGVFADLIAQGLQKQGAKATTVRIAPGIAQKDALEALKATNSERLVLLTIEEWDSDTYQNTDLDYNLLLEVFDAQGKVLASSRVKAKDNIENGLWNPAGNAEEKAPAALCERVERLFADANVQAALK